MDTAADEDSGNRNGSDGRNPDSKQSLDYCRLCYEYRTRLLQIRIQLDLVNR
jgi:hypothetical protein